MAAPSIGVWLGSSQAAAYRRPRRRSISPVGADAIDVTALILLYPTLPTARIVGTDIAHAVPLTLVAGLGHWLLGSVDYRLALAGIGAGRRGGELDRAQGPRRRTPPDPRGCPGFRRHQATLGEIMPDFPTCSPVPPWQRRRDVIQRVFEI